MKIFLIKTICCGGALALLVTFSMGKQSILGERPSGEPAVAVNIKAQRLGQQEPVERSVTAASFNEIRLCQGVQDVGQCGCVGPCDGFSCGSKPMLGVDGQCATPDREPGWGDAQLVPWEAFAYGEYIGPHRTPHVPEYRLRVNDRLEFVYMQTRERSDMPYRIYVGDIIEISSGVDITLNQTNINVLSDGTVSLDLIGQVQFAGKTVADLQDELNERYTKYFKNPSIVVRVIQSDTPLRDIVDAVDARAGQGGQSREAQVSPDGTLQLPLIGSVPAVGLTLEEIRREVNARYRDKVRGVGVTPVLLERAPSFVFMVGEVGLPGRYALEGPTTVLQALALAQGANPGGNVRQVIVFRRDQNWRLTATKLDVAGALYGRRPHPSDDIWLRHSDIVLVPKKPIQRLSEAVDQYLTQTVYSAVPQQILFNFDNFFGN